MEMIMKMNHCENNLVEILNRRQIDDPLFGTTWISHMIGIDRSRNLCMYSHRFEKLYQCDRLVFNHFRNE